MVQISARTSRANRSPLQLSVLPLGLTVRFQRDRTSSSGRCSVRLLLFCLRFAPGRSRINDLHVAPSARGSRSISRRFHRRACVSDPGRSMENLGESPIPWLEDEFPNKASTSIPEVIIEENAIGTLVIIIISAILSITLLFVMAVFIDCRHQKLAKIKQKTPKKVLRISIPRFSRPIAEDQDAFADKMQTEDTTPTPVSVIV